MHCLLFTASLLVLPSLTWAANVEVLEEVIVTATLRAQPLVDVPNSVTVLETQTLKDAGQQHFQDVLGLVPNLNWAGGTSRPRFFQIRGIGEREQYEGAPNPSVGLLIDDIDFSGLGMPATLFDVKQIEVLRGPQGTRYGANALAGLIAVRGNDPEQEAHHGVEASVGNYGTRSLGVTATAPVESLNSAWRLSVQQYRSDGFRSNPYLQRNDTDGRDELTGRFKWRWQVNDDATLDFTLLHANLDNGYDGWSIDNSRVSLSDKPGKDSQRATGVSARLTTPFMSSLHTTVIASYLKSDSTNSFDADWGNSTSWRPYVYDYFMSSDRERINRSLEVRLASDELSNDQPLVWLVGAYVLRMNEQGGDELWGRYADPGDPVYADRDSLHTDYQATNLALFGQLDGHRVCVASSEKLFTRIRMGSRCKRMTSVPVIACWVASYR
jgi:iron complex outermembrane recepter protein